MERAPYKEKLEALREVTRFIPDIQFPELVDTPERKQALLSQIKSGQHPQTKEGLVVYKLDKPTPLKVKIRPDFDAKIIGTFDAKSDSKYYNKGIGGFLMKPEDSDTIIRVGTGLTDSQREEAFRAPTHYIGQWAQVASQHKHKSGLHQAPSLKAIRSEKFMNKAASAMSAANKIHAMKAVNMNNQSMIKAIKAGRISKTEAEKSMLRKIHKETNPEMKKMLQWAYKDLEKNAFKGSGVKAFFKRIFGKSNKAGGNVNPMKMDTTSFGPKSTKSSKSNSNKFFEVKNPELKKNPTTKKDNSTRNTLLGAAALTGTGAIGYAALTNKPESR